MRNSGCPKPCISQLEGTSMSSHFLVLKFVLKKSFGIPSGLSAYKNFHFPFKEMLLEGI